ncbi:acylase [Novacetimonas pomaceti]|uniref:Acylase n=2 Tax=Novacetimonas pomaceti TaxID=2021998 RepID=A0A318Q8N7_9PROT|nr:acylase [Novacetimonas pomaceti]
MITLPFRVATSRMLFLGAMYVGMMPCGMMPCAHAAAPDDTARLQHEARRVTITRDNWGIAHVRGRTDADAVFGASYAQAEDDFNRVETNYLVSLGRLAEAEGESALWQDLRMRLFVDPAGLQADYATSPRWLKRLMNAWADGLNWYLRTHPQIKPRVITHFEPWMALSFTEGSIGGDVERISLTRLQAFYENRPVAPDAEERGARPKEPKGSNGIAIAPSRTADGHALLLINPHTSFFFRSELQMTSDQGLNAYGAVTWGQFFIYQGFNPHAGWMHTSSGVDVVDEFAETVTRHDGRVYYRYGNRELPVETRRVMVRVRLPSGGFAKREFNVNTTRHGPVVRTEGDRWISTALMYRPVPALEQSFLRTKAKDYAQFLKISALQANSSNNTIFADRKGEIAYLHPQFVPRRDDRFDYRHPVDGSDPATDWHGLHALSELPQVINPSDGWVMNTNDWPWSASGGESPRRENYPRYMDMAGENPRGIHATRLLDGGRDFTARSLMKAAYDPWLPEFALLVPQLVSAWEHLPAGAAQKARLAGPVALLRGWDNRWAADSTATSLAVFWGDGLLERVRPLATAEGISIYDGLATRVSDAEKLDRLDAAVNRLVHDFGSWQVPWGTINRFQRINGDLVQPFSDAQPSMAVPFTSAIWGSLASFGAKRYPGTKRYYGTSGNSFVAVVEFGRRVHAWAVSTGGESSDPASRHFTDQAQRYSDGNLREVYFHPAQLRGHVERRYAPGG